MLPALLPPTSAVGKLSLKPALLALLLLPPVERAPARRVSWRLAMLPAELGKEVEDRETLPLGVLHGYPSGSVFLAVDGADVP